MEIENILTDDLVLCCTCGETDDLTRGTPRTGSTLCDPHDWVSIAEIKSFRSQNAAMKAAISAAAKLTTEPAVYAILLRSVTSDYGPELKEIVETGLAAIDTPNTKEK